MRGIFFVQPKRQCIFNNLYTFISAPPVIEVNETLVFAPQGTNFQFPICRVRSNPTAKVTWKRLFRPLPSKRFSVHGNSLNISDVHLDDDGLYICEAENFLGIPISFSFIVK